MKIFFLVALALMLGPLSTPVNAACKKAGEWHRNAASTQDGADADLSSEQFSCLGGEADSDPTTQKVRAIRKTIVDIQSKDELAKVAAVAALEIRSSYSEFLRNLPEQFKAANVKGQQVKHAIDAFLNDPSRASEESDWRIEESYSPAGYGKVSRLGSEFYISEFYRTECADIVQAAYSQCDQAMEAAFETIRVIKLMHIVAGIATSDQRLDIVKNQAERTDRKAAFYNEALMQYPWELLVNSCLAERDPINAPSSQVIFFHPEVAVEYVGGAPEGEAFKPALVLEVLGYNRWSWTKDNHTKNAVGASLGVLYTDRRDVKDAAFALTVHIAQDYSFGASIHGDDWGFFVNIPLSEKIRSKYDKISDSIGR